MCIGVCVCVCCVTKLHLCEYSGEMQGGYSDNRTGHVIAHHMTVALGVCSCVWASAWCAHMNVEVIATFISCTLSSRTRAATICDCYYINTVLIGSVWYMFKRKGASR